MHNNISWTIKLENRIKRETRVHVSKHGLKWQFKRSDEEAWDYDSDPTKEDWDMLEDILKRRAGRGRGGNALESVRKMRTKAGA
ncbi:MAG: hypothetical protein ISS35_02825 [Kiritimatiellae bacterium]|nr:hypothetical protein [Kiritimatiellia bacterium]